VGAYKEVQGRLREAGIVISKRGDTLRVNHFSGLEETAFYATNLQMALEIGLGMALRERPSMPHAIREAVQSRNASVAMRW
jgi:hypothetical protein